MRDAFSSLFDLTLLMVVVVIVCMLIALGVNYSKAYRMKEYTTTQIEKYNCTITDEFWDDVEAEANRIGYPFLPCETDEKNCTVVVKDQEVGEYVDSNSIHYLSATVTTYVGLDLPFINTLFDVTRFELTGHSNYCPTGYEEDLQGTEWFR